MQFPAFSFSSRRAFKARSKAFSALLQLMLLYSIHHCSQSVQAALPNRRKDQVPSISAPVSAGDSGSHSEGETSDVVHQAGERGAHTLRMSQAIGDSTQKSQGQGASGIAGVSGTYPRSAGAGVSRGHGAKRHIPRPTVPPPPPPTSSASPPFPAASSTFSASFSSKPSLPPPPPPPLPPPSSSISSSSSSSSSTTASFPSSSSSSSRSTTSSSRSASSSFSSSSSAFPSSSSSSYFPSSSSSSSSSSRQKPSFPPPSPPSFSSSSSSSSTPRTLVLPALPVASSSSATLPRGMRKTAGGAFAGAAESSASGHTPKRPSSTGDEERTPVHAGSQTGSTLPRRKGPQSSSPTLKVIDVPPSPKSSGARPKEKREEGSKSLFSRFFRYFFGGSSAEDISVERTSGTVSYRRRRPSISAPIPLETPQVGGGAGPTREEYVNPLYAESGHRSSAESKERQSSQRMREAFVSSLYGVGGYPSSAESKEAQTAQLAAIPIYANVNVPHPSGHPQQQREASSAGSTSSYDSFKDDTEDQGREAPPPSATGSSFLRSILSRLGGSGAKPAPTDPFYETPPVAHPGFQDISLEEEPTYELPPDARGHDSPGPSQDPVYYVPPDAHEPSSSGWRSQHEPLEEGSRLYYLPPDEGDGSTQGRHLSGAAARSESSTGASSDIQQSSATSSEDLYEPVAYGSDPSSAKQPVQGRQRERRAKRHKKGKSKRFSIPQVAAELKGLGQWLHRSRDSAASPSQDHGQSPTTSSHGGEQAASDPGRQSSAGSSSGGQQAASVSGTQASEASLAEEQQSDLEEEHIYATIED